MTTPASPPSASSKNASAPAGIELRGRLVEQQQLRLERERRGEADALQLAAGDLGHAAIAEARDADRGERALHARQDRRRAACRCSRARTRPRRRRGRGSPGPPDPGRPSRPFPRARSGACVRVSRPATSTRPSKRPPWNHGTSPASARTSVDLPEPDAPSSSTTSPRSTSSETSRSAGADSGYANVSRSTRARATALRRRRARRQRRPRRGRAAATARRARASARRGRSRAPPSPRRG